MMKPTVDAKGLRNFALTLFCALGILGGILVWRKRDVGFILWGIGSAALLVALVFPKGLRPVYKYWMKLALVLGFISSHAILALLYYLVFTPTGFLLRMFGKNPLALQFDKKTESYWIKKEGNKYDKQRYEKLF